MAVFCAYDSDVCIGHCRVHRDLLCACGNVVYLRQCCVHMEECYVPRAFVCAYAV